MEKDLKRLLFFNPCITFLLLHSQLSQLLSGIKQYVVSHNLYESGIKEKLSWCFQPKSYIKLSSMLQSLEAWLEREDPPPRWLSLPRLLARCVSSFLAIGRRPRLLTPWLLHRHSQRTAWVTSTHQSWRPQGKFPEPWKWHTVLSKTFCLPRSALFSVIRGLYRVQIPGGIMGSYGPLWRLASIPPVFREVSCYY